MNSIERVSAAIKFGKPDRVPVLPQVFGHAAALSGVALSDYVRSGDLIARCQMKALDRYGHDAVFALMDVCVETEAIGSELVYRKELYPCVRTHVFSQFGCAPAVPNPAKSGRMPELLKAIGILRSETRDEVPVIGCVLGPMTLATQLIGFEKALFMAADNTADFENVLDFSTMVITRFGVAQIESGAHLPLVFDPSATPEVVPPQFFRELLFPRLKKVFSAFKAAGALANWLHIAGDTAGILPFYPEIGVDIANFDYCVEPLTAQNALPETCLDGNVNPSSFILSSPEIIASESARLLAIFSNRGGFILSSGCEIPPEAKQENIKAMTRAVLG
jgi:uroporphyrinogen decarboxylase